MTLPDRTGDFFSTEGTEFLCRDCGSPLVQPLEWIENGPGEWSILFRCPECFHHGRLCVDEERAQLLENAKEEAARSILEAADLLDRETFRRGCENFIKALRRNHVDPADF